VRHDFKFKFIGAARDVLRHGTLPNPDRPDRFLDQAAADKIRNYREPYARTAGQSVAGVSMLVYIVAHSQRISAAALLPCVQASV